MNFNRFQLVLIALMVSAMGTDLISYAQVNLSDVEYSSSIADASPTVFPTTAKLDEEQQKIQDRLVRENIELKAKIEKMKKAAMYDPKLLQHLKRMEKKAIDPELIKRDPELAKRKIKELEGSLGDAFDSFQGIVKEGEKQSNSAGSVFDQMQNNPQFNMETSPFCDMSERDIDKLLLSHPSPHIKQTMTNFPKLRFFMVHLFKDKKALPSLLKIPQDKKRMKRVMLYGAGLFVFLVIWGLFQKKNSTLLGRLGKKLFSFVLLLCGNLLIFYSNFSEELDPTVSIFKKIFLH